MPIAVAPAVEGTVRDGEEAMGPPMAGPIATAAEAELERPAGSVIV